MHADMHHTTVLLHFKPLKVVYAYPYNNGVLP